MESQCSRAEEENKSHQSRIDDLAAQLRNSAGHQKAQLRKVEEAQQIDRQHSTNPIAKLRNQLKISEEACAQLKALYFERDRDYRTSQQRCDDDITKVREDADHLLSGASSYFHSFLPSLESLNEIFNVKIKAHSLSFHSVEPLNIDSPKKIEKVAIPLRTEKDLLKAREVEPL
jgi:hypothetical protein